MPKKRITILLGAGASIEFLTQDKAGNGLSTFSLTNLLRPNGTDIFLEKNIEALSFVGLDNAFTKGKEEYKKLYLRCVEYSMHHGFNFEETIHLIDSVVDTLGDHGRRYKNAQTWGKESSSFHICNFFKAPTLEEGYNTAIEFMPFDVRHYLLQHIAEHHAPAKDAYKAWGDFFYRMTKESYSISIFNLNYDRLMMEIAEHSEQNGICFCTGFDLGAERSEFDSPTFYKAKNILAQLHGSVNFVPCSDNSKGMYVDYFQDLKEASNARMKYMYPAITQDNRRDYNWAMVTGLSKFEYIAKEPYATYYRRLIHDLDESDIVLIMGYGGGDRHMNMLLKSPLTKGKNLFVVDYADDKWKRKKVQEWDHQQKLYEFLNADFFNLDEIISDGVNLSNKEKCTFFVSGTNRFILDGEILV